MKPNKAQQLVLSELEKIIPNNKYVFGFSGMGLDAAPYTIELDCDSDGGKLIIYYDGSILFQNHCENFQLTLKEASSLLKKLKLKNFA